MEEKKIYKPISCEQCPAVRKTKDSLVCGCYRQLTAKVQDEYAKRTMHNKCPIDWDKKYFLKMIKNS